MSSIQNIEEHGDNIEKLLASEFKDELTNEIHNYNKLWGNYIGNNTNAEPQLIEGHTEIDYNDKERLLIGQFCYTLLFNLLGLQKANLKVMKIKDLPEEEKFYETVRILQEITFLIYNSIDIQEKFSSELKVYSEGLVTELTTKQERIKKFRNTFTHRILPSHRIVEDEILIPFIKTDENKFDDDWIDNDDWVYGYDVSIFDNANFMSISEILYEFIGVNKHILNKLLKNGLDYLEHKYPDKKIKLNSSLHLGYGTTNNSGSLGNPPNVSPNK